MSDTIINGLRFSVSGMRCAGCVEAVEKALSEVSGVRLARVNFADHTAWVEGTFDSDLLIHDLHDAGYDLTMMEDAIEDPVVIEQREQAQYHALLLNAAVAGSLGLPLMLGAHLNGLPVLGSLAGTHFWSIISLITLVVIYQSGGHFYRGAWKSLLHGQTGMDTLIALGTGSAWLYSTVAIDHANMLPAHEQHAYFESAIVILAFINLGSALELRARGKTSSAIRALMGLQPRTALVIRNGIEQDVAITEVGVGESIRVRPGEKIPVDGILIEGESAVDESMLSGEPMPVIKSMDHKVIAGSINQRGTFIFRATHIGRDTVLAQIIASVRSAQSTKPALARMVDKVASVFVPAVVLLSCLTFLIWLMFGPEPSLGYAFVTAMTVLIIACPCALGLATPISVMVSVGKAAQKGILIRRGDALQSSGSLSCVILDKTGTITEGHPVISGINLADGFEQNQVLRWAASLEVASEHPLAAAVLCCAKLHDITPDAVDKFESFSGLGVTGIVGNHDIVIGNEALMARHQISMKPLQAAYEHCTANARTPLLLGVNGKIAALFEAADPIKPDSKAAVERLIKLGIRVIMVTGDQHATASAIANLAGIQEFRSQVLPQDKAAIISELQQAGERVGMVGDGINDAPALAQSDVGFAIGTGTDIAIESADVVIMSGSLTKVSEAIRLSRLTVRNIKQNLLGAFLYNTLSIPIAAGLLFPMTGMLLNPVIGGIAMALSSLTVVANANRLRWL